MKDGKQNSGREGYFSALSNEIEEKNEYLLKLKFLIEKLKS
jgi:hypothetical protein